MSSSCRNFFSKIVICLVLESAFLWAQLQQPEYRGVWLSRDVIIQGRSSIRTAFQKIKQAGFNSIFVNNWYQGGTIYPSQVLKNYGAPEQLDDYRGWDPLRVCIEEAGALGLEVHVWFEYGLVAYFNYSTGSVNPGPILSNHPDWLMQKRDGQNWANDGWNNRQFWLDPASAEASEFLTELFRECAEFYPEIKGIQMDRIRYPDTSFSFSAIARQKYQQETGGRDPLNIAVTDPDWQSFLSWRKRQTSNLAAQIYQAIKSVNPQLVVSAAVVPPYMLEGSQNKLQDWHTWWQEKSVDLLCSMLYGLHPDFNYWIGRCLAEVPAPLQIAAGVAVSGLTSDQLNSVYNAIRNNHLAGSVVWHYGDLDEPLLNQLHTNQFPQAVSTLRELLIIDDSDGYYVKANDCTSQSGGWKGSYQRANSSAARFTWRPRLYTNGRYRLSVHVPESIAIATPLSYAITINDSIFSQTIVTQNEPTGWYPLGSHYINYSDSVAVTALPNSANLLIADAVALQLLKPWQIIDGVAVDDSTIILRFDRTLSAESLIPTKFQLIPSGEVLKVSLNPTNSAIVTLQCTALIPNLLYSLKIWDLFDQDGNCSDTIYFQFTYNTGSSALIDNSSNYFKVQLGNWTISSEGAGFVGTSFLKTPAGDGSSRVYWRYPVPVDSYYTIKAFYPVRPDNVRDALFLVKNGSVFDTVRVNQQEQASAGRYLATVFATAGTNLVVKLHNLSAEATNKWVVADAVQFQRALIPVQIQRNATSRPAILRVSGNFPNPFNATTQLVFEIANQTEVTISIYDLQGRCQRVLRYPAMVAGQYTVLIDCHDLNSGVYLYKITAAGTVQHGKMLLVK